MSNQILNIVATVLPSPAADFDRQQVTSNDGPSFSSYIEKKCMEMERDGKNLLGVNSSLRNGSQEISAGYGGIGEPKVLTDSDILQHIMLKLQEFAQDKNVGAGEWSLPNIDADNLANLCEAAGMDPAQFGILNLQINENSELKPVLDLLSSLEQHFARFSERTPVTAPETSLPLVQTLLERLAVPVEQVAGITEKSVNDFGQFDLSILLDGLKKLGSENEATEIPLSEWETEQLKEMLSQAGLSKGMQEELFPQGSALLRQAMQSLADRDVVLEVPPDHAVRVTLGKLKEMFEVTIADAETVAPKANPPAFLHQLESILGQSGFKEKELGWTPVVQESVRAVFQELQRIFDHAKVKIEKNPENFSFPQNHVLEDLLLSGDTKGGDDLNEGLLTGKKGFDPVSLFGKTDLILASHPKLQRIFDHPRVKTENISTVLSPSGLPDPAHGELVTEDWLIPWETEGGVDLKGGYLVENKSADLVRLAGRTDTMLDLHHNNGQNALKGLAFQQLDGDVVGAVEKGDVRPHQARLNMSSEMQHFTLNQISQTVLRGLKNTQHQLTLTLYPKELGEVKVDMQVRDNQVSLSFLMENPKVKELLESNMQEFRNSMEQRGFVLGECNVSADQNSNESAHQKQFELAQSWKSEGERKATLAEITDLLGSGEIAALSDHDGLINTIV